jgi:hypothetical protein
MPTLEHVLPIKSNKDRQVVLLQISSDFGPLTLDFRGKTGVGPPKCAYSPGTQLGGCPRIENLLRKG